MKLNETQFKVIQFVIRAAKVTSSLHDNRFDAPTDLMG